MGIDVPEVINLLAKYVEEEVIPVGHHRPDWEVITFANNLTNSINSYSDIVLVAVEDGKIIGYLWAGMHPLAPWTSTVVASDYLFYVMPEHRGSLAAYRLIRAYKEWALEVGCVEVRLSLASGIHHERTGALFTRMGFEQHALVFNHKAEEK